MTEDEELADRERRALAEMRIDVTPPPALEERVVAALSTAGMLRRRSAIRVLAAAAVILAAFSAGLWSEHRRSQMPNSDTRFLLLLYGGTGEAGEHHAEYADWAKTMSARGVRIDGEELSADRVEVSTTAPSLDGATGPNGYFIVSARTMEDARRIAESCPHVRYAGRIVIRPIVATR